MPTIRRSLVACLAFAAAVPFVATGDPVRAQAQSAYVCDAFAVPGGSRSSSMVTAKDGNVWYADIEGNRLVRVDAEHKATPIVPVESTTAGLVGVALAADGAIWYGKEQHRLGRVPAGGGKGVEYELPAPSIFTKAIATSGDGRTWFADPVKNDVGYMAADGKVTTFDAPVVNGSPASPEGIATAADGSAWVTSIPHNAIYRVDPATGTFSRYDIATPQAQPSIIVRGAQGAMWFVMPAVQKIGRIAADGTIAEFPTATLVQLGSLAEGPDGAMYVSSRQGIGRLDPASGHMSTFACDGTSGMTVGPDHHLWVLGDSHIYVVKARHEGATARVAATGTGTGATIETVSADTIHARIARSAGRVVVAYTSDDAGCGYCTRGNARFASLAANGPAGVRYLRVLFEPWTSAKDSAEASRVRLTGLPTFVAYDAGKETARYAGDAPLATLRAKLGL